jgi:LmbE family N-acetylglucosaminyl deacetylase
MKRVAIIIAHPNDETLWAGGTILSNTHWNYFMACLCRGDDESRALRFYKALKIFRAEGIMGSLNDDAEQLPLEEMDVENAIMKLLPSRNYDLIITHNPAGDYTKDQRHEETGLAVIKLWNAGKIFTKKLWLFAYEDGNRKYFPRAILDATIYRTLTKPLWRKKFNIINKIYGFRKNSRESKGIPGIEAFWQFTDSSFATEWLNQSKTEPIYCV